MKVRGMTVSLVHEDSTWVVDDEWLGGKFLFNDKCILDILDKNEDSLK